MNDILRAYGKFDVAAGQFSLYSQLAVRNDRIAGYVKPLFSDVRAFDPEQDRDKGFLRRLYERIVGGVSKILKNSPATRSRRWWTSRDRFPTPGRARSRRSATS
jgi:hypothetical protein